MSISSAPAPEAVSRSRPAIRSRLVRRDRVAATWVETSTSRASSMRIIVSAHADILCAHGLRCLRHRLERRLGAPQPRVEPGLAVPGGTRALAPSARTGRPHVQAYAVRLDLARHP